MESNGGEDGTGTCSPLQGEPSQVVNGQKLRVTFLQPDPVVDWEQTLTPTISDENTQKKSHLVADKSPVEVERKFIIPEDCEERIKSLGGLKVKEQVFHDIYFDTEDFRLTLQDMWLRTREGVWQLKYPPEIRDEKSSNRQYCETESQEVILQVLTRPLADTLGTISVPFTELVSRFSVIADITTTRTTYHIDGVQVTLDVTDTDFRVGEIEVMVNDKQQLGDAIAKIDSLASKLGVKDDLSEGKVEHYLRTRNPTLFRLLVHRNVLSIVT